MDATSSERSRSGCDPRVRAHIVCPQCLGDLEDRDDGLACPPCQLLYAVVDGVPWLLPERARALAAED